MIFLTFNCDCALLAAFETFYEKHLIIIIIIIVVKPRSYLRENKDIRDSVGFENTP